jgi:hypothetical protein
MSTRANIIIKDKHSQLIFYRHSDGYPSGTLPTLKKFMKWVAQGRIRDNADQASGWLILIGAKEYDTEYIDHNHVQKTNLFEPSKKDESMGWKCGAYEPTTGIHIDIEYLYTLDLTTKTMLVQEVEWDSDDKQTLKTIKTIVFDESGNPKYLKEPVQTQTPKSAQPVADPPRSRFASIDMAG